MSNVLACAVVDPVTGAVCTDPAGHGDAHRDLSDPGCILGWRLNLVRW